MPNPTLQALADRVAKAIGPSRELEGEIAKAFGELPSSAWWMDRNVYGEVCDQWVTGGYGRYEFHEPPEFTGSVDAALSLVERVLPGWTIASMSQQDDKTWFCELRKGHLTSYSAVAMSETAYGKHRPANLPLAILSALLKAIAAPSTEGERDQPSGPVSAKQ